MHVRTVKHAGQCDGLDSLIGNKGRRNLYFLLKNITASGCDYINVLIFKGTFVSTLVNS